MRSAACRNVNLSGQARPSSISVPALAACAQRRRVLQVDPSAGPHGLAVGATVSFRRRCVKGGGEVGYTARARATACAAALHVHLIEPGLHRAMPRGGRHGRHEVQRVATRAAVWAGEVGDRARRAAIGTGESWGAGLVERASTGTWLRDAGPSAYAAAALGFAKRSSAAR
jgi:hypothetical protein